MPELFGKDEAAMASKYVMYIFTVGTVNKINNE